MKGIIYFSGFGDKCSLMRQSTGGFECWRIVFAFFRSLAGRSLFTFVFFLLPFALFSQAPQGFNYQAVVRDANGKILANQAIGLRISILQGNESGTVVYSEQHTVTTNSQGLVAVVVGKGTAETGTFADIDWNKGPWYLKVEVDENGGSDYKTLGVSALMSVPYALQAGTVGSLTRLNIQGDDVVTDSALFVVKRKDGQIVFAVYNDSVVVHVNDAATKGPRGGFVVGGFGPEKGSGRDYMRVTPDSTRIYINNSVKGPRGGFAIGGLEPDKGGAKEFFKVSTGSNVDIVNPSEPRILWYPLKEAFLAGRVLVESPDSVGNNSVAVGYESKSVGDFSQAFGYQAKATGVNAAAFGKSANASGDESYAIGNYAYTGNAGSYAIGSGATATGLRSFAVGSVGVDSAGIVTKPTRATGDYSYAFGMGSIASERGAFALGTQNIASGKFSLAMGYNSRATAFYSTAMGYETNATAVASTALGWRTTADGGGGTALGALTHAGPQATAMGYVSSATGFASTAIGYKTTASQDFSAALCGNTIASGLFSLAGGYGSIASGDYSTALGTGNAKGHWATAMGRGTVARAFCSFVTGAFNDTLTNSSMTTWEDTDPLFIVGNGTAAERHNAMMIRKNGEVYFPDVYNSTVGLLRRELYIDASGRLGYVSSSRRYKKNIRSLKDIGWLYRLRPVKFVYKNDPAGMEQYGLIAEEVEKVNPLFVSYNQKGQVETVSYSQLITPMLKALQEQQQEIERLKAENGELAALRKEVEELKRVLGAMARQK